MERKLCVIYNYAPVSFEHLYRNGEGVIRLVFKEYNSFILLLDYYCLSR